MESSIHVIGDKRNQLFYIAVNPASYDNGWPDKTCLLVPQCHEFYEETNLISYACYCLLVPNPVVKEIIGPRGEFNLIILLNG